ncbi:MAG: peptidase DmpA [Anaerolineales bacterium]|nr:peptidase DmpA [Anaerolineales bacterium]
MSNRSRAREIGLTIGTLPTGPLNAITDVAGVCVGHVTLIEGEGPLIPGVGPVRTGVTAILPHAGDLFREKVAACVHRLNGFGEVTNADQVREMGVIESPILLTGTTNVPRVADAALDWAFARDAEIGVTTWNPSPLVAECSDMYLNDARGRHVHTEHVIAAIEGAASGPVAEGGVGGGTGMSCCEFKGGVGTSSRVIPAEAGGYTVGVLVMSNFGRREHLRIDGVPVGQELLDWPYPERSAAEPKGARSQEVAADPERSGSSIIIVLATDAPLDPRQLERVSVRAGAGLARTGGLYSTSSGDFVIAFSTTNRVPHFPPAPRLQHGLVAEALLEGQSWPAGADPRSRATGTPAINYLFQAAIEATEEAILNSIFAAETMVGRDQHVRHALPIEEVVQILRKHGRAP